MVLDVEARDVLARTAVWKGDRGPGVRTPLLLETGLPLVGATEGILARREPEDIEGILAGREPEVGGVLVVRDLGSSLRPESPGVDWAHLELPAEHPLPPALADQLDQVPLTATDGTGMVEAVHGASRRLVDEGPPPEGVEWTVLASAAILASRPDRFVDAVIAARRRAGAGRLLYLPGVATPRNLALLTYMGTDVVDDVMCRLEAARGRMVRPELGHVHGVGDLSQLEVEAVNQGLMRAEVELVRATIEQGALRELVEVRTRSEPWQVAALRRLDRHHRDLLLPYCPVHRDTPLLALTRESMHRIEVTSWVDTMTDRYSPPPSARVLLLLPCSARKPYSRSRTHKGFSDAMERVGNRWTVHEVILTSPLGAVPRELERTYPAAHYDIPVSGDWYHDEVERMRLLVEHILTEGSYDLVISHMGEGLPFLAEDPEVASTRRAGVGPLDREALGNMARLVAQGTAEAPRVEARTRKAEDVASIARFQFGRGAAKALMADTTVEGRPPAVRIMERGGGQRGMVVPARGRISLTLRGAAVLAGEGTGRVWMDDFDLRGDLFAVGVTGVDPGVRPGEEVAVVKADGQLTGVGVARMAGPEMVASRRGVAVSVRHKASGGEGG